MEHQRTELSFDPSMKNEMPRSGMLQTEANVVWNTFKVFDITFLTMTFRENKKSQLFSNLIQIFILSSKVTDTWSITGFISCIKNIHFNNIKK